MAHVREAARKSGRAYEVRWKDVGHERQRTFAQKREAERFAARVDNTIADGGTTAPLTGRRGPWPRSSPHRSQPASPG